MKIVADEGIDAAIVFSLRKEGNDVIYILEIAPGISDEEVIETANEHDALVLTSDKDFGELIFKNKMISNGIILCRLHGLPPKEKADIVQKVVERFKHELTNSFTVIGHRVVKIRSLK